MERHAGRDIGGQIRGAGGLGGPPVPAAEPQGLSSPSETDRGGTFLEAGGVRRGTVGNCCEGRGLERDHATVGVFTGDPGGRGARRGSRHGAFLLQPPANNKQISEQVKTRKQRSKERRRRFWRAPPPGKHRAETRTGRPTAAPRRRAPGATHRPLRRSPRRLGREARLVSRHTNSRITDSTKKSEGLDFLF